LAKDQHALALRESKVKAFVPYCLRHTALTTLGEVGCDAFTLAKIAGHSSISITQRYVHPQADAIERAFAKLPAELGA
jgi:site-specific recombinase XerD